MHFEYNGQSYRVRFMYESGNRRQGFKWGGQALSDLHNQRITTYCEISVRENNEWRGLAGAYVVRDPRDPFTKDAGRRKALTHATRQLTDKTLRNLIWNKYFLGHRLTTGVFRGD
jgi:hypothetical protein